MSLQALRQLQIDLQLHLGLDERAGYAWCYRLEMRNELPLLELRQNGEVLVTLEVRADLRPRVRRPASFALTFNGAMLGLFRTRPKLECLGEARLADVAALFSRHGVAGHGDAKAS